MPKIVPPLTRKRLVIAFHPHYLVKTSSSPAHNFAPSFNPCGLATYNAILDCHMSPWHQYTCRWQLLVIPAIFGEGIQCAKVFFFNGALPCIHIIDKYIQYTIDSKGAIKKNPQIAVKQSPSKN